MYLQSWIRVHYSYDIKYAKFCMRKTDSIMGRTMKISEVFLGDKGVQYTNLHAGWKYSIVKQNDGVTDFIITSEIEGVRSNASVSMASFGVPVEMDDKSHIIIHEHPENGHPFLISLPVDGWEKS